MLELRVLGSPHLRRAGAAKSIGLQPKRLAVLSYLALEASGSPCRRDALVALFWPELDGPHARNALSQALHGLRRGLGAGVIRGGGTEELWVEPSGLWCDGSAFEAALGEGRFADAVELYAGPLLDGLHVAGSSGFEDWLSRRRARLRGRMAEALQVLVERRERAGNFTAAAESLRQLAELSPGDEAVVRRWMRALERAGDAAGALRVYDRFERELAEELDLPPSAETVRLAERLRRPPAEPSVAAPPAIAVLPFADLSPERDHEYFCHGLTEEVITALAREPGLRVTARTSVFAAGVADRDIRELGQWLGVDVVMEGSVRRSGSTLRVTAQLIDASTGYHVWSERFDRQGDALGLQDEIADAVAATVRERLASTPGGARPRSRTRDAEAHDHYLRGLYHRRKRTRGALAAACDCFRRCVARDPDYADGHAALAFTHALAGWWLFDVFPPRLAYPVARASARRALALDDGLPEAHLALAYTRQAYDWDGPGAEVAFARALALDPDNQDVLGNYAGHLVLRERFDEAIEVTREAERLDPGWIMPPTALGLWMLAARRYDDAEAQLRRAAELEPRFFMPAMFLGDCFRFTGRTAEAAAEYDRAVALVGREPILLGRMASAAAERGNTGMARSLVAELEAMSGTRHVLPSILARARLAMGEVDAAFRCLDRAVEARDTGLVLLPGWPGYDRIRGDPRFDALLDRVRLWPPGSASL
jgi:TolB-like protein/Flp pilus assembly protein TadD